MMHVLFKVTHKVDANKWSLVTEQRLCYPGSDGLYCSSAYGHETHNPDGQAACTEQGSHSKPKYEEK